MRAGEGRDTVTPAPRHWIPSSIPLHPLPIHPHQDYQLGIGITYIEMNVGNVKEVDRRGFDLTTPYRIFR